jgi:hypothetical protein
LCELAPQRLGLHEVRERALAVDLDDGQELPVALLEVGVPGDVDLHELERPLGAHGFEDAPRRHAEVAVRSVEEDDPRYGYGYRPRVIVASETRWTARP